jgi:hypothetical protein
MKKSKKKPATTMTPISGTPNPKRPIFKVDALLRCIALTDRTAGAETEVARNDSPANDDRELMMFKTRGWCGANAEAVSANSEKSTARKMETILDMMLGLMLNQNIVSKLNNGL